ncbi:helix-turn-helix transcriptional regulator [Pelistega europaea]|uniref:WYL domain-containing protein n=1 Tax=Pelistega europaea TaxID=106147 RepID=A0A7Y4P3Q3_9BURK|nr:WYL domain-containing protein [Pelistega europaea]NOL49257.1 WYL domain-containing protein [Pelistega europaea]
MSSKHEKFAYRLSRILEQLNKGQRLDIQSLADEFQVDKRTIQRDLNERLDFLAWQEKGPRYYSVDRSKLGHLTPEDIQRFARFCSIQDLFPEIDRRFYQKHLTQSVQVKGVQYENIDHLKVQFDTIQQAIDTCHVIEFRYIKANAATGKYYQVEPYALINKIGVWYLVGIHEGKQKTFCFTQISAVTVLKTTFDISPTVKQQLLEGDSIYYGNQLNEVVIQVSSYAAPYFIRRSLLPNQMLVRELDDGGLLLACNKVNEMEIVPIVQYWIPHLTIISPVELQEKMVVRLEQYVSKN